MAKLKEPLVEETNHASTNGKNSAAIKRKHEETVEEKKARRKAERKRFKLLKNANNPVPVTNKALVKNFSQIWKRENKFITEVLQVLPEVRMPHLFDDDDEKMEDYLLEEESAPKTEQKREKFLTKMRQGKTEQPTRALTHEELKERLHAKLATLSQKRNEKKRQQKLKKLERKSQEGGDSSDKKKQFISKANPNLKNQSKEKHNPSIKDEKPSEDLNGSVAGGKTPLRKKPVVKSNGEMVFSKFDFISGDRNSNGLVNGVAPKSKPKPEEMLKSVQKAESKIARLQTLGKQAEAVSLVESQKWDSALKRADGAKIRDDPTLLKKTIKKQEKRKQVSKKKWQERTERVEKQKEVKQEKRKSNIQARKEEKNKKNKKQQRKTKKG